MNNSVPTLARRYVMTLRKFAVAEEEANLEEAYDLGRTAIASGFGVLDMARIHQKAFEVLLPQLPRTRHKEFLRAAETFSLESLSPFEVTHRGFCETNRRLRQLIANREKRNQQLASINQKLNAEIRRRKLTEKALRRSERHYRALFNQARFMEESLRNLSNQILDIQEGERKRISRELHDETGQALTAISVTLASLGRDGQSPARRQRTLREAQRLLQSTMETLHDFARELRPTALDELGLLPALRSYLKAFAARTGLKVEFEANAAAENLEVAGKLVLFRVAQESLTNVAKHARATRVDFQIRKVGHRICMTIRDNGKSFRPAQEDSSKRAQRLGLLGMKERVRLVNGEFSIRPEYGKGTTVQVVIPIENDARPIRRKKISRPAT